MNVPDKIADNKELQRRVREDVVIRHGEWKDMGESGGYSPSATASRCEKGGSECGGERRSFGDVGSGVTLNIGFIAACGSIGG